MCDRRLVPVGVAPAVIDRAQDLLRIVLVEEGTGAVVDRLSREQHVVGVHHAVDESDGEPSRDELGLAGDHAVEHRAVGVLRTARVGEVAFDDVVEKDADGVLVTAGREVLDGADTDVALSDAREHGAGHGPRFAEDLLPGGHGREASARRDPDRGHPFAHDVLAQHRAERGLAVPGARIGRSARSLELHIVANAVPTDQLSEQDGSAVAEARVPRAELVPRVDGRDRLGARRDLVSREGPHGGVGSEPRTIDPEMLCERLVHADETRLRHRHRLDAAIEGLGQAGVAVVEAKRGRAHAAMFLRSGRSGQRMPS